MELQRGMVDIRKTLTDELSKIIQAARGATGCQVEAWHKAYNDRLQHQQDQHDAASRDWDKN